MFTFFKKKPVGSTTTLTIKGMHCASCAMLIDNELESLPGVTSATTSYAQSQTSIEFNPSQTNEAEFKKAISKVGYQVG